MSSFYRHKLTIWAVSVSLMFVLFWELDASSQAFLDPYIVLFIGVTKQIIVLMMILLTRKWSWRAIGVMSVMQGVAILYLGSALLYWNQSLIPEWSEPTADLGRSFLIVGLVPLLIGVMSYGWVVTSVGIKRRNSGIPENDDWEIPALEKGRREKRLDDRAVDLDGRAVDLDGRAVDLDKEILAYERRSSKLEDRADALEQREKE